LVFLWAGISVIWVFAVFHISFHHHPVRLIRPAKKADETNAGYNLYDMPAYPGIYVYSIALYAD
jgi:hypothetical protein